LIDYQLPRTLLRAAPYRDFTGQVRQGKIHLFREEPAGYHEGQRTFCGKTLEACPGEIRLGYFGDVDCKVCRNSIESAERYAESQARWSVEAREREAQRREESRQWWLAYDQYLQSPTWREKRRMVLRRARGLCEGCGVRPPVQVHHRCYPQGVWPGSAEWIRAEKLFELVALCTECHDDLHLDREDEP